MPRAQDSTIICENSSLPRRKTAIRMTLASKLSPYFGSILRERGFQIYRARDVHFTRVAPDSVYANVVGTMPYKVTIALRDGKLALGCSCPYAESNGHCKHLWAVVLSASDREFLKQAAESQKLDVVFGRPEDEPPPPQKPAEITAPAAAAKAEPPARPAEPEPPPEPSAEHPLLVSAIPVEPAKLAWKRAPIPSWQHQLQQMGQSLSYSRVPEWPEGRQVAYVIDGAASRMRQALVLRLVTRDPKKSGNGWNMEREFSWPAQHIEAITNQTDREIIALLSASTDRHQWYVPENVASHHEVHAPLSAKIVELAARAGTCYLRLKDYQAEAIPISWDDGEPWRFRIHIAPAKSGRIVAIGELYRGSEAAIDIATVPVVLPGILFIGSKAAPLDHGRSFHWVKFFAQNGKLEAMRTDAARMAGTLLSYSNKPEIEISPEVEFRMIREPLVAHFRIRPPDQRETDLRTLRGEALFQYGAYQFYPDDSQRGYFDASRSCFVSRDDEAEQAAFAALDELVPGTPIKMYQPRRIYKLSRSRIPATAHALIAKGWRVEAEGKAFRRPMSSSFSVTSGIDWFELHAELDFDGPTATLPQLLKALRKGENIIPLSDGTYGLLPQEWLDRFAPLAAFGGDEEQDHVRFKKTQAGLLDALLASEPQTTFDEGFQHARRQLKEFEGIRPMPQPESFNGQLRGYQRDGLGWMSFLRRFQFGGCLADDMGVGKTAQVLAMLDARRAHGEQSAPSLIVLPRSLVFNWKQEAARFTPNLRVLDYTGVDRDKTAFAESDVVLTTYGIMRRDILALRDTPFDYVVLDEAQAIKNAASESAKAARLLKANHRLALSGTPVENHLGELASIFEFLNPGMLGNGGPAQLSSGFLRNATPETREMLARSLRPFILRRTKQQVARELPAKTEQTILCEMDGPQRKLYDELRQFYRNSLLGRVAKEGLAKSKIQVLEALLRLRQAACHPGLLDVKHKAQSSAKIETLLEQLKQVVEEGHKALVFSQFTSLLGIVKPLLDAEKIRYEYLDGSTTDRQAHVERFQNDPDCPLFLISLKAGGLGLNLTAAEYVYLLDPWWNPAVEAQAIDRTHRIGQTRQVFAYRLITKDTVEEKVLALQATKRDLANAIIGEDNSLIRDLKREDLEMLLG